MSNTTEDGTAYSLMAMHGHDVHVVCYIIDALSSNSMKSKNPHSGFHEEGRTKCLDTSCLNPSCNQGGVVIVESLQRTGKRPYGDETE